MVVVDETIRIIPPLLAWLLLLGQRRRSKGKIKAIMLLMWPAAPSKLLVGCRRDAVAVILKIMVAMVVLVTVFCTTDKE
jgi:hypothetical protein